MLQPDTAQVTADAVVRISAQLANHSLLPVSPEPFSAATSSVTINCLWFLSLVFSLAAALFGMLTKQWLREYMEWTTTSWTSQNSIILRQKRYEAFLEWRVPAIIAAIPALLEVSVILFYCGLIILLWNIDQVVSTVVTAAIIVIISLAIVITVLPVFRPRCPYKSPSGWAFLRSAWMVMALWEHLRTSTQQILPRGFQLQRVVNRLEVCAKRYKTWRDRDFDIDNGQDEVGKATFDTLGGGTVSITIHRSPLSTQSQGVRRQSLRRASIPPAGIPVGSLDISGRATPGRRCTMCGYAQYQARGVSMGQCPCAPCFRLHLHLPGDGSSATKPLPCS